MTVMDVITDAAERGSFEVLLPLCSESLSGQTPDDVRSHLNSRYLTYGELPCPFCKDESCMAFRAVWCELPEGGDHSQCAPTPLHDISMRYRSELGQVCDTLRSWVLTSPRPFESVEFLFPAGVSVGLLRKAVALLREDYPGVYLLDTGQGYSHVMNGDHIPFA